MIEDPQQSDHSINLCHLKGIIGN